MKTSQLNVACTSLQNINKASLHVGDPGSTGANDSGETKKTLTWSTPSSGHMQATVTFTSVSGTFTHVGLWDDSTFIHAEELNVTIPTAQDLIVRVEFTVAESS